MALHSPPIHRSLGENFALDFQVDNIGDTRHFHPWKRRFGGPSSQNVDKWIYATPTSWVVKLRTCVRYFVCYLHYGRHSFAGGHNVWNCVQQVWMAKCWDLVSLVSLFSTLTLYHPHMGGV